MKQPINGLWIRTHQKAVALWDDELCTKHSLSVLPFLSWFTWRRKWLWHVINTLREKSRGKLAVAAGSLIRKNITYSYFWDDLKGTGCISWRCKWYKADFWHWSSVLRWGGNVLMCWSFNQFYLTDLHHNHAPSQIFPWKYRIQYFILVRAAVTHGLLLKKRCSWGVGGHWVCQQTLALSRYKSPRTYDLCFALILISFGIFFPVGLVTPWEIHPTCVWPLSST